MLQREERKQRWNETIETTHAKDVYWKIKDREKERQKHEKRWFWELLQNAKDSVDANQTIKVKLEITDEMVSFSHTGNPFKLDEIYTLIQQGSSKTGEEGKGGRFGSGFITTYLLSREVTITGGLENDGGYFHFLLNRNTDDINRFCELQQKSYDQFDDSFSPESYLPDNEFQTKFTYILDDKGKEIKEAGLECIYELIPVTLLFNEKIDTVSIIKNGKEKIFTNSLIRQYAEKSISEWQLDTIDSHIPGLKAYLYKDKQFMTCILTKKIDKKETIFFTDDYPRLFLSFPLIGTEETGIPLIIDSVKFDPKIECSGIYFDLKNPENSYDIIRKALLNSLESFAELFKTKNIDAIFEIFNFNCNEISDDNGKFLSIKKESIDLLASKEIINYNNSGDDRVCLERTDGETLVIPLAYKKENIESLWDVFSYIKPVGIPLIEDLSNWLDIAKNISFIKKMDVYDLPYVWNIERLINNFIVEKVSRN